MTDQELIQALKVWRRNYYLTVEHDNLLMDVISALAALQAENAELRTRHRTEHCEASGYDCEELGKLRAALSRMEAERDAGRPSAEALEAIDELVEFARDRMSIGMWLGYVNVLNEWRGAQGEV